jgi:predicted SAM-dependent methyltransferase
MKIDFSHTAIRIGRPLTSYSKVQNLVGWALRNQPLFAKKAPRGAYLDIGCGPNIHAGIFSVDYAWRPGLDLCWDVTTGLPLPDKSVAGIFTEHCIEHISFESFVILAREFRRVLIPGSVTRVIVPDGELYALRYLNGGPMPYGTNATRSGLYTKQMSVNEIFYAHGHKFIYDFETLGAVLDNAGFRGIEKLSFGKGSDPKLILDNQDRAVESLYVEAVS